MKLELTLVQQPSVFSPVSTYINRKTVDLPEGTELKSNVVSEAVKFLNEQADYLETQVPNRSILLSLAGKGASYTLVDLMSVRYLLAASGFDLKIYAINELDSQLTVEGGGFEYNYISKNDYVAGFVPTVTRSVSKEELSTTEVLESMYSGINPFGKDMIPSDVIIKNNLDVIKESETLTGRYPTSLADQISDVFLFLGLEVNIIKN